VQRRRCNRSNDTSLPASATRSIGAKTIERDDALQRYYDAHPERFVRGPPKVPALPTEVFINPVIGDDGSIDATAAVNFPTLRAAKKSLTPD